MKKMILVLLLVFLVACQETEETSFVAKSYGQAVIDLQIVTSGDMPGDIQLGFLPPQDMKEANDDFEGWLLIYDTKDFDQVYKALEALSLKDLKLLCDIDGNNQGYLMNRFDYADGLGNTLNTNQKTFINGDMLSVGQYHFYVATVTKDGVVGLKEAGELMDIKPKAENIRVLSKEATYEVTFTMMDDGRLKENFLCVSEQNLYDFESTIDFEDLKKKSKNKEGVLLASDVNRFVLDQSYLSYEGQSLKSGLFNVYVVSLSDQEILSVKRSSDFITNASPLKQASFMSDLGTVMLIGGGVSSADHSHRVIFEHMLEASGGSGKRLAILSSSRMNAETVYNHYYYKDPEFGSFEDNYKALGFEPVFIPLAIDNGEQIKNSDYWVSVLKSCHGVYLQGGDQFKHIKALYNEDGSPSKMLKALWEISDNGGLVAGTSAGMAAMGQSAYGFGYSNEALTYNDLEFYSINDLMNLEELESKLKDNIVSTPGIGLIEDHIIVDTHFDQRGRLGRLLVAMKDANKTLGIGVDEGTSFTIWNQIGQVIGSHGVFIVDAKDALYGDGQLYNVDNLVVHYLTEGDRYDLWTGNAMLDKSKLAPESISLNASHTLFEKDYETTKLLIDFARSDQDQLKIPYKLSNQEIINFIFEKTDKTQVKISDSKYNDSVLSDYYKTSIENLSLSVVKNEDKDEVGPVITYMKSYTKAYKVYLGITDNMSAIDETSINEATVIFKSNDNTLYEPPYYDQPYQEIAIIISEDAFLKGDQVIVDGVKDSEGNAVIRQTWTYDGQEWVKE